MTASRGHTTVSLSALLNMSPGDILPTDFSGVVILLAEDVPVFRGTYGQSGGFQALKLSERVGRHRATALARLAPDPGAII